MVCRICNVTHTRFSKCPHDATQKATNQAQIVFPAVKQARAARSKVSKKQPSVETHAAKEETEKAAPNVKPSPVERKRKVASTEAAHEEFPSLKRQKSVSVVKTSPAIFKRKGTPNVLEKPVSSKNQNAAPVKPSFAAGKRKMTAKIFEEQVSPKRQKSAVSQTASPVPRPFKLESPSASESIFKERARRAAEKAQREEIVRAARLEKCKKKRPVKHCSASWAAEIKCGVCLETTLDEDELCLSDPSGTDDSSNVRNTAEVHSVEETVESVIDLETDSASEEEEDHDEAVDEDVESVIDLAAAEDSDVIEGNNEGDDDSDDDNVDKYDDDLYSQLLETDLDFNSVELDVDGDDEDDLQLELERNEEHGQGQELEQELERNEEEEEEQEEEQEWFLKWEQEQEHHREQEESEEQWERRRALERRREDALRLANEKVNAYGPAFVDASAMADRETVVETFYQHPRTPTMSNPSNPSPPGIGGSTNRSLAPSLAAHGRSVSQGSTALSSQQASFGSDGDNHSLSPQKQGKREKLRNFLRWKKHEDKAKVEDDHPETMMNPGHAASTDIASEVSSLKVSSSETASQVSELTSNKSQARLSVFSENVSRTTTGITLPSLDARIECTSQLVLCITLLPKDTALSSQRKSLETAFDLTRQDQWTASPDGAEQEWIKAIGGKPVKQDHLRWLGSRIVEEFIKHPVKDQAAVSEVVLLGFILNQAHYRKLLNCFIEELNRSVLLDTDLLQGLVQLVQSASPTFLLADDLVKILSILRARLSETHQQSSEHLYHLTLAVARILGVMAEPAHQVKDLPRVEQREPLAKVLAGLQGSSDPYLLYQALYALQALQYVPDDESTLQTIMRHSLGAAESLIKVSGVIQLNFEGMLEGLKQMQKTVEETYGIAKSSYEGVCSLIDSGRGLFDSLKKGLVSGHKYPWYPAVLTATALCRAGQLKDFSKLVREVPCRRDPRFQWGVSQLLGEIAMDQEWVLGLREQAVTFLGDLYLHDTDWGQDDSVKSWMLTILRKISEVPDTTVREAAIPFLQAPTNAGSTVVAHPYPLRSHLPVPVSSPLLAIVQEIPYVEYDLEKLQSRRSKEYNQAVYIPPQAKTSLQASDKEAVALMQRVEDFLQGDGQVFSILGDSGAGKSTFNRYLEHKLWTEYKPGGDIPLFINLPAVAENYRDIIGEQLRIYKFPDHKVKELKENRKMILICDGYDETQLKVNLHSENMLNQKGQAHVKMIISCRSTYLGQDYRDQFHPQESDRYIVTVANVYTEAVIVPFSRDQIEDYTDQFVRDPEVHKLISDSTVWSTKEYMDMLRSIPNLMELVKNPFLLSLSLRALPSVVKDGTDITKIKVTRLTLYNSFINQWLDISKRRLRTIKFATEEESALQELLEEGFAAAAVDFLKRLAAAIFKKQDGNPVVQYTPRSDKGTWKVDFFGPDPDAKILRESSPLSRSGVQYRFLHRSLLEYFYSRHLYETSHITAVLSNVSGDIAEHPLRQRNLVKEPSIVQFLAEHVQHDCCFGQQLHQIIERSKTDELASQAAANAITVLVRAGVSFSGADLRAIKIAGADLSGGQFDLAQLQGADLRNTDLRNIWLRQADLSGANMEDVRFGEYPYLDEGSMVKSCAYSLDGKTFAVSLESGTISLYDTATWETTSKLSGHTKSVNSVMFSPSGQHIASGSDDKTVRLWDAQSGTPGAILSGHTRSVNSVVFSPSGQQIASGSDDKTVRLWDAQTGAPGAILSGHTRSVNSVVFSPSGQQIVSGSDDKTVRLWDAQTGAPGAILSGHTSYVKSVVFSPSGQQIASGSYDNTVRLWDAQTGASGSIVSGHTSWVNSVVFSPSGQQIAFGNNERTVRLWDAQTGAPGAILSGHTSYVKSVVFSPSGQQIASGSDDKTVRLWDAQTGVSGTVLSGHTSYVNSVVFSPSGQQIASGSIDKTVRLWDAQTGAPGAILSGHTECVRSVVFSPSGQQIASGSWDNTVRLWDAQTGVSGTVLSGHTSWVNSVVFSPSGQQIASGSMDSTVRLWDAQTGAPGAILSGHTNSINSVMFSPSGQQIASGSMDNTVRLWDAQTGAPGAILSGHTRSVNSVVFSPSGQQIVSGSDDKTVRLWDAQTGAPGAILSGHTSYVKSVVFSPSGQQIASGSYDNTVRLWDAQTGASGSIVSGHTSWVNSVVFSPSGQQIAFGNNERTVRLWDAQTGAPGAILSGHTSYVKSVVFSPSGQQIASGSDDKTVRLWDAQTGVSGTVLSGHTSYVNSVVFSPSGQQIASGSIDKTVRLWDAQTGAPGAILSGHTECVRSVVFSPSGQQIASGSWDNTVRLWDAQTGVSGTVLSGHTSWVNSVVFSPSGQQIASGSMDSTVRLWDAQTGAPGAILSGHTNSINSVMFSPSGQQIASGSMDNTVRLWDAQTGVSGTVLSGHSSWVNSVVFSPSGQQIASGSMDSTVRLWDAQTGAPGAILSGHTDSINSVVFSSRGQQIASGSSDNTVRLWDAETGDCLIILSGFFARVMSIAWNASQDGSYLSTGCNDNSVRMWKVEGTGQPVSVRLVWSSGHDQLVVSDAIIRNAQGLSRTNRKLLEQRGAISKPCTLENLLS
ncbi:unnamed protein product [Mortierella alpina]